MNAGTAMVDHESRAEAAYTAMYDAARHSVKDYYEDARVHLGHTRSRSLRDWDLSLRRSSLRNL